MMQWELSSLDEAYESTNAVRYVVDRMLLRPSLNVLYGAPGTFKSLILAHMALHVVEGRVWLAEGNGRGYATVQGPVLWVDADNGLWRTKNRFKALGQELGIARTAELFYVCMPMPPLFCTDMESMVQLRDAMLRVGAVLCIIDNLGLVAGVDENSPMMSTAMANMRLLSERTDAALVLIHHQRKSSGVGRAGDALRGHSSIEAAIDLGMRVVREEGASSCVVDSTKSRDVPLSKLKLGFYYEPEGDGMALSRAGFEGMEMEAPVGRKVLIRRKLLAFLKESGPVAKTRLAEEMRDEGKLMGVNGIRYVIDDLVAEGTLLSRREGRSSMISLAEGGALL
jgi:RecA-family ATPase